MIFHKYRFFFPLRNEGTYWIAFKYTGQKFNLKEKLNYSACVPISFSDKAMKNCKQQPKVTKIYLLFSSVSEVQDGKETTLTILRPLLWRWVCFPEQNLNLSSQKQQTAF